MTPDLIIALISQTIVILIAIVGFAMRSEHRITKIEGKVEHIETVCATVPGISRAVARIEGRHQEIDESKAH